MAILEEHILTIPTSKFIEAGYFQGFNKNVEPYLKLITESTFTEYINRKDAENDPSYKQLIPYAVIQFEDKYFSYQRGSMLSESRLLNKYSLGIGGHISSFDENLFNSNYEQGLLRELNEEVNIEGTYENKIIGILNDDSDEVGKVHLGIVHILKVNTPKVFAREKSINQTTFLSLKELNKRYEKYENWSKIFINYLNEQTKE